MRGVADQALAVEMRREDALARRDGLVLAHRAEAERLPRVGRAFDDEGRAIVGEAIGMRPDPPRLGLLEGKGERLEQFRRAEPDEAVGALVDVDPERLGARIADPAVGAVGGDDEVPRVVVAGIILAIEADHDAELARAVGQYLEQPLAADADEAMPRRDDRLAADANVDVVPMRAFPRDLFARLRVVADEVVDRLVGKDHAPAKGHALGIALDEMDLVRRVAQLHRDGEGQPRGARADAFDLHAAASVARRKRSTARLNASGCSRLAR